MKIKPKEIVMLHEMYKPGSCLPDFSAGIRLYDARIKKAPGTVHDILIEYTVFGQTLMIDAYLQVIWSVDFFTKISFIELKEQLMLALNSSLKPGVSLVNVILSTTYVET
jgi:hypothetical protein